MLQNVFGKADLELILKDLIQRYQRGPKITPHRARAGTSAYPDEDETDEAFELRRRRWYECSYNLIQAVDFRIRQLDCVLNGSNGHLTDIPSDGSASH